MASIGRLTVQIGADVRGINEGLNRVNAQLNTFGKNLGGIGKGFATAVVVERLSALGKEAIQMSSKFESAFLKIKNLTDTTASDLKLFNTEVRKISANVGVSTLDLSQGLYNVTSAGLTGKAALEALEISAKGAAIGMGNTDEIAKALSGTLNAYGPANLSAARAAEILFKTTKQGAIDISELTSSLSGVTPLAAKMGVSLEEVGAFLATVSLNGTSASEGVTQLASILDSIIKPSSQAKEVLEQMGVSLDELKNVIKTKGLREGLLLLEKGFRGNEEAMAKFFGRREATLGFLGALGASSQKYGDILNENIKDTDLFGAAFSDVAKSSAQKWAVLTAVIDNLKLKIGDDLKAAILDVYDSFGGAEGAAKTVDILSNSLGVLAKGLKLVTGYADAVKAPLKAIQSIFNPGVTKTQESNTRSTGISSQEEAFRSREREGNVFAQSIEKTTNKIKTSISEIDKLFKGKGKGTTDLFGKEISVLSLLQKKLTELEDQLDKSFKANGVYDTSIEKNIISTQKEIKAIQEKREELRQLAEDEYKYKFKEQQKIQVSPITKGITQVISTDITDGVSGKVKQLQEQIEKFQKSLQETKGFFTGLGEAASAAFGDIAASLLTGSLAFKDLGKAALAASSQIVKAALASAIASVIQKAIGVLGIAGIAVAIAGIAAVKSLFSSKVPKYGKGTLAKFPHLAIVGDNPNAASDPEVIEPLSKLTLRIRGEMLKIGALLSRAFEQSLKEINFQSSPSNITVSIPSIDGLERIFSPVTNNTSILEPAPIQVNVNGSIRGNDIVLLGDRLGATNNRLKANKY